MSEFTSHVGEEPQQPSSPKTASANKVSTLAGLGTLIVEAGVFTAMISALIFVAGWSYADRYFSDMGLNLSALDGLSATSFSAFALWVFRDGWLSVIAFVGATVVGFGLLFAYRRSPTHRRLEAALAISVVAALSLLVAAWLGAQRATLQVSNIFSEHYATFSRVVVVAKANTELAKFLSARNDIGNSTCLRKVFMDHRNLYTYLGYESLRDQRPNILILPLSDIAAIEVVGNRALCKP